MEPIHNQQDTNTEPTVEEEIVLDSLHDLRKGTIPTSPTQYNLLTIDLADTHLKMADVHLVAKRLAAITGIKKVEIYLFGCRLTDEGLHSILTPLLTLCASTIRSLRLDLSENSLSSQSYPMLLEAMTAMKSLRSAHVDLSGNGLSRHYPHAINPLSLGSLEYLQMSVDSTGIQPALINALVEGIERMPKLKTLILETDNTAPETVERLVHSVLSSPSLSSLSLRTGPSQVISFQSLLSTLPRIASRLERMRIDLSECTGMDKLAKIIEHVSPENKKMDEERTNTKTTLGGTDIPPTSITGKSTNAGNNKLSGGLSFTEAELEEFPELRELIAVPVQSIPSPALPPPIPLQPNKEIIFKDCIQDRHTRDLLKRYAQGIGIGLVL